MKTTIHYTLACIALFFTFTGGAWAQNPAIPEIFISTSAGPTIGVAREFVFIDDKILSELEWPMYPVWSVGVASSLKWKIGLEFSAAVSAGIPGMAGTFKDSDFNLQPENSVKTHYSQHDGYLEHSLDASCTTSWKFKTRYFDILPSIGFKYLKYKWTAQDGYTQYGAGDDPWSEDEPKEMVYGTSIAYQQEYMMPTLGLSVAFPFLDRYSAQIGVMGSPYISCVGTDNHFLRNLTFTDIMTEGYLIEPSFLISWRPKTNFSLFLGGNWRYIAGLRGDTYFRTSVSSQYYEDTQSSGGGGGASFNAFQTQLGIEMSVQNQSR